MIVRVLALFVLLLASVVEAQLIPFIRPGRPGSPPTPSAPSITFTLPVADSVYETSVVAHVFGGTVTTGSEDVDHVSIQCSGDTTVAETNANLTGAEWSIAVELEVGTTVCLAKVYDDTNPTPLVGQVDKTFIITSPDADPPVVSAGADDSTSASTYDRTVTCTDDVEGVSVTWERTGVSATACPLAGSGTNRTADCAFTLAATNDLTTVNTITVRCYDQSGQSDSDEVLITRTVALEIVDAEGSLGSCVEDAACPKTITARGGTTGTYTFTNNGAGTTLNDADADCAGSSIAANGVISGPFTQTAPATCSFTIKVDDTVTNTTKDFTISVIALSDTFFEDIAALDEALAITKCVSHGDAKGCSLQDADQLLELSQTPNAFQHYTYDATEDAAELYWPQTMESPGSTIRVPIQKSTGTLLFIWDWKPTLTFTKASCGGMVPDSNTGYNHKEFQVQMAPETDITGAGAISVETQTFSGAAGSSPDCSTGPINTKTYFNFPDNWGAELTASLGIIDPNPYHTANFTAGAGTVVSETTDIPHNLWSRYWLELRLNVPHTDFTSWNSTYGITVPAGTYHMYSLWYWNASMANPVRIVYKAPTQRAPGPGRAITSLTSSGGTATLVATAAHNLLTGDTIQVKGANEADYNISAVITKVNNTTFTFPISGSAAATATGSYSFAGLRTGIALFSYEHNTSAKHALAAGFVTVSGTDGTVIPKNRAMRNTANERFFTKAPPGCSGSACDQAGIIAGGTAAVYVKADDISSGPDGNTAAAVAMTLETAVSGVTSAVTDAAGLTGGAYLLNGDMYAYARWFHALWNYTLTDGTNAADDVTQNPVIFQKPQ